MKNVQKILLAALTACVMSASFTGCGAAGGNASADSTVQTSSETEAKSEDKKEAGNVVVSSVACVEILDALGVPIAGVPTSSYALPDSTKDAVKIGNPMQPDMEVIASLNPNHFITASDKNDDMDKQLVNLGAETYYADLKSFEGLEKTIKDLGAKFGASEKAEELVKGIEDKKAAVQKEIEGKESPKVLVVFGAGDKFMVSTDKSYVGNLVSMAGGENILAGEDGLFIPIDMEYLAEKNPDYILLMAHANPEESLKSLQKEFDTNKAWQNFDAVKNGNVIALDTEYFGMSADLKAGEALEKLKDILYPEK